MGETTTSVTGHAGAVHYLNGQLGAWSPRQPQWQHWGALCVTELVHTAGAALRIEAGVVQTADDGRWLYASAAVEHTGATAATAAAWACMVDVVVVVVVVVVVRCETADALVRMLAEEETAEDGGVGGGACRRI